MEFCWRGQCLMQERKNKKIKSECEKIEGNQCLAWLTMVINLQRHGHPRYEENMERGREAKKNSNNNNKKKQKPTA